MTPSRSKAPARIAPVKADLIGVFVLAVGIAAVLGMVTLAYFVFLGDPSQNTATQAQAPVIPAQDGSLLLGADTAIPATDEKLQGQWEAPFSGGKSAVVEFRNGKFQMLFAPNAAEPTRLYTVGTYSIENNQGLISLQPNPSAKMQAPKGLSYEVLTLRKYKIIASASLEGGKLFLKPSTIEGVNDQIHPIFFHTNAGEDLTGWTRRGGP